MRIERADGDLGLTDDLLVFGDNSTVL